MTMIAIGLAVYNGERYLAATLEALLAQTHRNFEITISDNASTDGTQAICREFAKRDPRIHYHRQERNIGALNNLNCVLMQARAPYFKWSGHDDLLAPTYLERTAAMLDAHPEVVLAHSKTRTIDENGEPLCYDETLGLLTTKDGTPVIELPDKNYGESDDPVERYSNVLAKTITCHFALGLMRTEAAQRTRGFGLFSTSDRAFLAEIALYGRFAEVGETLFFKREHRGNTRYLTPQERMAWTGSSANVKTEKLLEYKQLLEGIVRSPLSPFDMARCVAGGVEKVARRLFGRNSWQMSSRPRDRTTAPASGS
jgi:glycosyltransferase involved in cell wall biosynthesis